MKYLTLLIAIFFLSCSTNSSQQEVSDNQNDDVEVTEIDATEPSAEILHEDPAPKEEETEIVSSENEDKKVRTTFLNMIDAINNARGDNAALALKFLDKDYVFKGQDRKAAIARLEQQFTKFKNEINDVNIMQLESSGNLAYLIASFKRTMTDRDSGEIKVDAKDKVGIFILRKEQSGEWKLLVQKTDSGFAHWYYMPEE